MIHNGWSTRILRRKTERTIWLSDHRRPLTFRCNNRCRLSETLQLSPTKSLLRDCIGRLKITVQGHFVRVQPHCFSVKIKRSRGRKKKYKKEKSVVKERGERRADDRWWESVGPVTVASYRRRHQLAEEVPGLYIRRLTLEDPRSAREPSSSRSQSPARHICHPTTGYVPSSRRSSRYSLL